MSKTPVRSGLKRQVSPAIAIVVIIAVVGLALLIGWGIPYLNKPKPDARVLRLGKGGFMQIANDRLGVSLGPGKDGIAVTAVKPGAGDGLQAGDIISAVNGEPVSINLTSLIQVTDPIQVGEKLAVEIKRNGKPMTLQVTRQKDMPHAAGQPL